MKTRYFVVTLHNELFGLFQSNHDGAINLQINQLLKEPEIVVKEVDEDHYKKAQQVAQAK